MSKYHTSDKLSREQHEEIAHLTNAGVPHRILADEYGVKKGTIGSISTHRARWLSERDIATTPSAKFVYAQSLYGHEGTSDKQKSIIEQTIFRPLAAKVAGTVASEEESSERLLKAVFGKQPEHTSTSHREEYKHRLTGYGTAVLKHVSRQDGFVYDSQGDAAKGLSETIKGLEEASLRPDEKERIQGLQKRIDEVLSTLSFTEQEVVKLRYGIGDRFNYTLEEVGKIFRVTKERVRQLEGKAIRKLQHPVRARHLASYVGLEDKFREKPITGPEDVPITDIELSVRARNCFNKMEIVTLGQLAKRSEAELLEQRNFGEPSLQEAREVLREHGLYLQGEQPTSAIPVHEAGLRIRPRLALEHMGCLTLEDVTQFSETDILEKSQAGITSVSQIRNILKEHGLFLKGEGPR
jgi:RNA polymerase sigma factor (sigma-70 family)